jgi:hypothetical protein
VQIQSLKSVDDLSGPYAEFHMSPVVVKKKATISGYRPRIRTMITAENKVVPLDEFSLELLTLYAHLEKLAQFDKKAGVYDLNVWPRKIGVAVNKVETDGSPELDQAEYVGSLDAMMFLPFTRSDMPFTVNGGVIAHEHFHSIFDKLFYRPLGELAQKLGINPSAHDTAQVLRIFGMDLAQAGIPQLEDASVTLSPEEEENRAYHGKFFRGVNEGFADVWGWLYSGQPAFISASLPIEGPYRALNLAPQMVWSAGEYRDRIFISGKGSFRTSYDLGTSFARIIYSYQNILRQKNKWQGDDHAEDLRIAIASWVVATSRGLVDAYKDKKADEYLEPARVVSLLMKSLPEINTVDCNYFSSLLPTEQLMQLGDKCPITK